MNREYGVPKTTEERMATHYQQYGTTDLPPRGTGLANKGFVAGPLPRRLTDPEKYLLVFLAGMMVSAALTYMWVKPTAFRAKVREIRA